MGRRDEETKCARWERQMRYDFPWILMFGFLAIELVVLEYYHLLDDLQDQVASYAFTGLTILAFVLMCFVVAYIRLAHLFDAVTQWAREKLEHIEELASDVQQACSNSCRRPVALDYWGCAGCCKDPELAEPGVPSREYRGKRSLEP
ncbi:unnamed protein product [Effrenium voratum]|uniref:Uncharacterized protein n=1 Tax=Effrenium voratum TaxID=2562239 RepID=A0AA36N3M4_9DINO|nr:unnamed protein product [Effrenium voratum]